MRHITVASERLQIIDDFYRLSEDIQKIASVSREGRGSLFGMFIYLAESDLMQQQISVWMLGADDEKRWKRIANSKLISDGKEIKLDRGRASFESEKYQDKVTLELLLFPKNTFTFEGRDFAIIRTDIPFAGNDDYSTVYLCEMKNGKLQVRNTLKMAYFSKWEIHGKKLMIFGHEKEKETFSL